ncbi:MAG: potassium channel family protein [Candidatus Korobacteraceae bacterium]
MPTSNKHHRLAGEATKKARAVIADSWQSQANLSFFLTLLVITGFLFPCLGFGKHDLRLYSDIAFSIMLISGVAIAWGRRTLFLLASCIAVVALGVRWLALWKETRTLQLWGDSWTVLAIFILALVLLVQVFRTGPVTHLRIQGAIAVYLLFGLAWAHAYHIANILLPGSFNAVGELSTVQDWAYYSFVTLTTVGYGDITPVHPIARNLAITEALTGQLYLAVMLARLVAMEVITWQEKSNQNSH